jgi:hypothetical protein
MVPARFRIYVSLSFGSGFLPSRESALIVTVEWITLPLCVLEILGSHLGSDILIEAFDEFPQSLQADAGIVP